MAKVAKGHLRPSHSAPLLAIVRYASNSDQISRPSEMTLSANKRHRSLNRGFDSAPHIHIAHVPVDDPPTASKANI